MKQYMPARPFGDARLVSSLVLIFLLLAFPFMVGVLFQAGWVRKGRWMPFVAVGLLQLWQMLFTERITCLVFDTDEECLLLYKKRMVGKELSQRIPFAVVRLEVLKGRPLFRRKAEGPLCHMLYIKENKKEVAKLDPGRDGFTPDQLQAIASDAKALGVEVMGD